MGSTPAVDIVSACAASLFVSPWVCIVDKSIISNASGRQALWPCMKENFAMVARTPHKFLALPEFRLIWGVYAATYGAANLTDSWCEKMSISPLAPVFVATTAVNMTSCIYKDRAFTRMFGTVAPKSVPLVTYLLFAARDSLTILASFTAVPVLSQELTRREKRPLNLEPITFSQLACPMFVQLFSTPMHLWGLDLYNNPRSSRPERINFVRREYVKSVAARVARIAPAFGIGGVSNRFLRNRLGKRENEPEP